jgi:hypothetical protein
LAVAAGEPAPAAGEPGRPSTRTLSSSTPYRYRSVGLTRKARTLGGRGKTAVRVKPTLRRTCSGGLGLGGWGSRQAWQGGQSVWSTAPGGRATRTAAAPAAEAPGPGERAQPPAGRALRPGGLLTPPAPPYPPPPSGSGGRAPARSPR